MRTKLQGTIGSISKVAHVIGTLFVGLLLIVLLLVATLIGGLGVVLVGRALTFVSGLGLFEASLIALGVAIAIVTFFAIMSRPQHTLAPVESDWEDEDYDEDEDLFEDEDEFEEEEEPPAFKPPPSRNAPCPCGSGKKYKHCHGK